MRRFTRWGLWLIAAAIGAGSYVAAPQAAKAEVYIRLPSVGIYLGDRYRRGHHHHRRDVYRDYPRRYVYDRVRPRHWRYGPPPRRHFRHDHWRGRDHWRGDGHRRGRSGGRYGRDYR